MIPNIRICLKIVPKTGSIRNISTSVPCYSRRNFRKFPIVNKRGVFEHAKLPKELLESEYDYPVTVDETKTRYPGVYFGREFVYVKEMEPELVVPDDFESCELKPYVSHKVEDIEQSQFTAQQLFNATYGKEIVIKFRNNEPIPESFLEFNEADAEAAKEKAQKCGADLFDHTSTFGSLDSVWKYK